MGETGGVAGVLAALSVSTDLARGRPPGEAMRATLVATELARRAGVDGARRADVYYATLLRFAGCAATSHELAALLGGDDILVRSTVDGLDPSLPGDAARLLAFVAGRGRSGGQRLRLLLGLPGLAAARAEGARADCEVGAGMIRRLRLPDTVRLATLDAFERDDGRGFPAGKRGAAIAEPARFAAVGHAAAMFHTAGGDVATALLRRWSGRALDPDIVALYLDAAREVNSAAVVDDTWTAVVAAEPEPARPLTAPDLLDEMLAAFGDAADLKSPWFSGHSRAVSALAAAAAPGLGADPLLVRRAGLVLDLGRLAVATGTWERPGPLAAQEWEQVRLHPYHSARVLVRSPLLAPLGRLAGRHHERLDGSGYPAGIGAGDLDGAERLLAAADVLTALRQDRPHRRALDLPGAARALAGLPLDREAVKAILDVSGAPRPAFPRPPSDLTEREMEVIRLLVAGRTKRQAAAELHVSEATIHTHTVHIYEKCEVSTRAGLAMFAMRHGLVGPAATKID